MIFAAAAEYPCRHKVSPLGRESGLGHKVSPLGREGGLGRKMSLLGGERVVWVTAIWLVSRGDKHGISVTL